MTSTHARRRSLGTLIRALVLVLVIATSLVVGAGTEGLRRVNLDYDHHIDQAHALEHDAEGLLTALLNQEVGLRAYLATGEPSFLEPYQLGQRQEKQREIGLRLRAAGLDDPSLTAAIDALVAETGRWHQEVAEPQIRDRGEGQLRDLASRLMIGKRAFDQLRSAHDRLLAAIDANVPVALAAKEIWIRRIREGMFGLVALVLLFVALAANSLARKITAPLNELVRRAEQNAGFPAPSARESIHEVHALATSLHRLDAVIRDREGELAHAHDDALALARFGEFAQQQSSEDDLHLGLERACHALVAPSQINILVRNASKNRLDIARSTARHGPSLRLPILQEPMKCRAVRTMRDVRANSDAPTACNCTLGVPAQGSMLCVPMLAAGELIGVVNLQSDRRDAFADRGARALHGYIGFASGAISSLQLLAATRERALRDSLTGAHNRAFLSEYLPKTLAAATRHGSQVAVLMTDLDHFKRINDQYGHPVGDQAITAFARCVQQQIRASDALVRYGGEEFAVLLTDVTVASAASTAERIRVAIEQLALSAGGVDLGNIIRVSIGIAMFPEHGNELQELLAVADGALYAAKQQGRNRVVVAELGELAAPAAQAVMS